MPVESTDRTIEGRDWIGKPDGTLIYWQAEAEMARAKLSRIRALPAEVEPNGMAWLDAADVAEILDDES